MPKEKSKELFTKNYIRLIKLARELNEKTKIYEDLYFHPTEKKIRVKTIDLNQINPLREVNSKTGGKQDWEERWVEAYLISQAKKNNWKLGLAGKEYIFLSSQLKFRRGEGEKQGRILDLLLYDKNGNRLVVLELKRESYKETLDAAKTELNGYIEKLNGLLESEKEAFEKAFGLRASKKGIVGYVVWPEGNKGNEELDLGEYGLIEYTRPWKKFKEVKRVGKDLEVEFICRKCAE